MPEKKSSDDVQEMNTQTVKEIHQEESFDSPDGRWTLYITATSDGEDIKLDPDWVESDNEITNDDDFYGEYKSFHQDYE